MNAQGAVNAILALGSNLGASRDTLSRAVAELADLPGVRLQAVSPVVRTRPVGGPEQPDFLNLVVSVETDLDPHELLAHCQAVENAHHREREVRWGPRTLDVDIITYGDLVLDDETLTIPHPRAHTRAFVLQPWAWMDPGATLNGTPVSELAARAEDLPGLEIFEGD
ncbi:2-amino-4-hydroxy-6-hydroxymethyldihydropteridine diphosphokinase [Arthrobacter sp. zg-ZUI100]|uniref:2-amino-4-hydroxy-6- hydroxymethyldihydropteridine diphosphokinase n=1 Tax=Arthrobacter jiangjiafuii TaxID=2817475 RepID=UPI001AEE93DF|nr:2-amino-4-hydroxy-6-hydroxymethyldihydropteridine diphosphokinase [Arthrobacter jiangjiafuii]